MTQTMNGTNTPKAVYSHSIHFPGAPLTTVLNACVLLLNAYGIKHGVQYDPNFTTASLNTGNQVADARFQNDYLNFKMMLDGLIKTYSSVECTVQSNGTSLYMKFTCY
jgi:hypothetical protein